MLLYHLPSHIFPSLVISSENSVKIGIRREIALLWFAFTYTEIDIRIANRY
jgi:hypothetical protein